jgi:hypothetical protein
MKPVRIDDFNYLEGRFVDGKLSYEVQHLIQAAENLETFDLPLCSVSLRHSFTNGDLKSFLFHYKRIENADLSYPIILAADGYICDGWHRVAKAILLGHTTIKAKRLIVMPEPEFLN